MAFQNTWHCISLYKYKKLYCIPYTVTYICTLSSLTRVNLLLTSVMGYLKPCWADTKYSVIFKNVCIKYEAYYIFMFYVFHIYILAVV